MRGRRRHHRARDLGRHGVEHVIDRRDVALRDQQRRAFGADELDAARGGQAGAVRPGRAPVEEARDVAHVDDAPVLERELEPLDRPVRLARAVGLRDVAVGHVGQVLVDAEDRVARHLVGRDRREQAREVRLRVEHRLGALQRHDEPRLQIGDEAVDVEDVARGVEVGLVGRDVVVEVALRHALRRDRRGHGDPLAQEGLHRGVARVALSQQRLDEDRRIRDARELARVVLRGPVDRVLHERRRAGELGDEPVSRGLVDGRRHEPAVIRAVVEPVDLGLVDDDVEPVLGEGAAGAEQIDLHRHVDLRGDLREDERHARIGRRHVEDDGLDVARHRVLLEAQRDEQHVGLHVVVDERRRLGRLLEPVVVEPLHELGAVVRREGDRHERPDVLGVEHGDAAVRHGRPRGRGAEVERGRIGAAEPAVAGPLERVARLRPPRDGLEHRLRSERDVGLRGHGDDPGEVLGSSRVADLDVRRHVVGRHREDDLLARLIDRDLAAEEPAARARRTRAHEDGARDEEGCDR